MLVGRYLASPILGACTAIFAFGILLSSWPDAGSASTLGTLLIVIVGIVGGIVSAIVAPSHRVMLAAGTGLIFGSLLLISFFIFGQSTQPPHVNALLWYWPIWLLPSFFTGGIIGNMFTSDA